MRNRRDAKLSLLFRTASNESWAGPGNKANINMPEAILRMVHTKGLTALL